MSEHDPKENRWVIPHRNKFICNDPSASLDDLAAALRSVADTFTEMAKAGVELDADGACDDYWDLFTHDEETAKRFSMEFDELWNGDLKQALADASRSDTTPPRGPVAPRDVAVLIRTHPNMSAVNTVLSGAGSRIIHNLLEKEFWGLVNWICPPSMPSRPGTDDTTNEERATELGVPIMVIEIVDQRLSELPDLMDLFDQLAIDEGD